MTSMDNICNSTGQYTLTMDLDSKYKQAQGTSEELCCGLIMIDLDSEEEDLEERNSELQTGVFDSTFMMLLEMEYVAASSGNRRGSGMTRQI